MGGVIAGDAQQKIPTLDGVEEANVEVVGIHRGTSR